jgi:hypothetical protein
MNSHQTEQFPSNLPVLRRLLDDSGLTNATLVRGLTAADIEALLRSTPLQFIVFDLIFSKLQWIPPATNNKFWEMSVKSYLVEPTEPLRNPFGCYQATEWRTENNVLIIVLTLFYWPV